MSLLELFIGIDSMAYFLSIHSLSSELEQVTFLSLIVGISHFSILGKNFPQSHLIILRECPQKQPYPHVKIFQ